MNKNPSLLDGLNLPESMTGKPAQARRDLAAPSQSISNALNYTDWSPTQKKFGAAGLAVAAIAVLIGGAWFARQWVPPSMPTSFAEGVAVIQTGRINNLDDIRRAEYLRELGKLWPSLSEEQREAYRKLPGFDEAMDQIREEKFVETDKKIARGEEKPPQFGPPPGEARPPQPDQRPQPRPNEAGNRPGPGGGGAGGGGGNGRGAGRNSEQRRAAIVNRIGSRIMTGNPQNGALRMESRGRGGGAPRR